MAYKDNREYIAALEKIGEAIRIEQEVDWDCEAGAIVRRVCELGAPAPFFQKIKDYPGHRMVGGLAASTKRISIAMDMNPNTSLRDIVEEFSRKIKRPIKPVLVGEGPCQQNVVMGKEVDLTMFPAPMVHDGDGGRYIGTWHALITKDPETGWVNWGMYRLMVHNERLLGALVLPHSDAGKMLRSYEAKEEPMPCAVAIGMDPICSIITATPVGIEVNEVEIAGGLCGDPVELVKCKTVDLEVPAHSEIILEGHILPNVLVEEGPFGEYTGFRSSPRHPRPVIEVKCITWRNDPIMTMSNMGMPIDDSQLAQHGIGVSAMFKRLLEEHRIPITGVYVPPEGCGWIVIVAARKLYNNIAAQIASIIASHHLGQLNASIIIVVDEGVDPFNWAEVVHAMGSKLHPLKNIFTFPAMGNPLAPFLSLEERRQGKGGKVVLDCTWPLEWDPETEKPVKSSFREIYPEELQRKVLENWHKYGF